MTESLTVGDPEAMRAFARELRARADAVRSAERLPAGKLERVTFEGPAANRLRATATDLETRVVSACNDLESAADAIVVGAATVEARNDELRRAAETADAAASAGDSSGPATAQPEAAT